MFLIFKSQLPWTEDDQKCFHHANFYILGKEGRAEITSTSWYWNAGGFLLPLLRCYINKQVFSCYELYKVPFDPLGQVWHEKRHVNLKLFTGKITVLHTKSRAFTWQICTQYSVLLSITLVFLGNLRLVYRLYSYRWYIIYSIYIYTA